MLFMQLSQSSNEEALVMKLNGRESSFLCFVVQRPELIESFRGEYRDEVFQFAEKIVANHPDAKDWIDAVKGMFIK